MRIENRLQEKMLDLLVEDFGEVKHYTPAAFDRWRFTKDFDRHSPCRNLLIETPNGSEIKIFVPNSHMEDVYNEEFDMFMVYFNVFGEGEDSEPLEFDMIGEVVNYLLEQWESNNL